MSTQTHDPFDPQHLDPCIFVIKWLQIDWMTTTVNEIVLYTRVT